MGLLLDFDGLVQTNVLKTFSKIFAFYRRRVAVVYHKLGYTLIKRNYTFEEVIIHFYRTALKQSFFKTTENLSQLKATDL